MSESLRDYRTPATPPRNRLLPTAERLLFHVPAFMRVETVTEDEAFDDLVVLVVEVEGADDNTTWRAVTNVDGFLVGSRLQFHIPTGEAESFPVGRVFTLDAVIEAL